MITNKAYEHVKPLEDFDWDLLSNNKYNTTVNLTEEDKKARVKIMCQEPYAQELYDLMVEHESGRGTSSSSCEKDFKIGSVYSVEAKTISFDDKVILVEEVNSMVQLIIPFKEYAGDIEELTKGNELNFKVIVYRADPHGEYYASERKCRAINYFDELIEHQNKNNWFEVKIVSLIKGGYIALYKNEVKCFIPGSHAGANVIHDFSTLLGKTINVMIDNYDRSNSLFILSYKKYVKHSLPIKIRELRFNKPYVGTLTTKPYDFGMFVEFEGYYTGLLHSSNFDNYNEVKSRMKTGDEVSFWIKDVTFRKKQYRIILTLDKNSISEEFVKWDNIKEKVEGKAFDFEVSNNNRRVSIEVDGEPISLNLNKLYRDKDLNNYSKVSIFKVDVINKTFNYRLIS